MPREESSEPPDGTLLISRLLNHPVVQNRRDPKANAELVALATALLQSRILWDRALQLEMSLDPVWTILLLVYVRQAESAALSISQLRDLRAIAPVTVLLRWVTKLVSDDILEIAENGRREDERVVRLSPDALRRVEDWLMTAKDELEAALKPFVPERLG